MADFAGVSYPKMLEMIIDSAIDRVAVESTGGSLARILLYFYHWPSFTYDDL